MVMHQPGIEGVPRSETLKMARRNAPGAEI
jgi:hypothetical protein